MSEFFLKWATMPLAAAPIAVTPREPVPVAATTEANPGQSLEELARASDLLNRNGVRILQLEGVEAVGVWSDLDGPEVRAALRTLGGEAALIRYLDGDAIPPDFKARWVDGEPVPGDVRAEMERNPADP